MVFRLCGLLGPARPIIAEFTQFGELHTFQSIDEAHAAANMSVLDIEALSRAEICCFRYGGRS
eukprot:6196856-Pleurochrysis_carterae.AAC.1